MTSDFSTCFSTQISKVINLIFLCILPIGFLSADLCAQTLVEKRLPELEFKISQLPPHSLKIDVSNLRAIRGATIAATSSYVPNPPRIVLDIQGVKISRSHTFLVTSGEVKGVRLGVHPDQVRLVIDLHAEGALNAAVEKVAPNHFGLAFSVKKTPSKNYHQPVKSDPEVTALPSAPKSTNTPIPMTTDTATATATAIKNTPTPRPIATKKEAEATIALIPTPVVNGTLEKKVPVAEENLAALPIRKVPAPPTATSVPATAIPATPTPKATQTSTPEPTLTPAAPEEAPLSSLIDGKSNSQDLPSSSLSSPSDPLSHQGVGFQNDVSSGPIGPKDASQYLVEVRFDYQIQDHDPLLRLVMMSGANFNLVKKHAQLYQLVVPKSGIKTKVLAQPHFPPHDFVGFTLVNPRYENESLIIDIGVDRGTRISAFARGNEIWVRGATK